MANNIVKRFALNGGVNLFQDPSMLQDNETLRCKNAYPDLDGIMVKRPSATSIQRVFFVDPSPTGGLSYTVPRAIVIPGNYPFDVVAAVSGSDGATWAFQALNVGITEHDPFPGTAVFGAGSSIFGPIQNPMDERPSFFTYNSELWAVVGDGAFQGVWRLTDKLVPWNPALDPSGPPTSPTGYFWVHYDFDYNSFKYVFAGYEVVGGLAPTANLENRDIPVKPKHAGIYKGRAVYANFGPGMKNWLVFADTYSPPYQSRVFSTTSPPYDPPYDDQDAWFPGPLWIGTDALSANGRHLTVYGMPSDDEIVAVREISLSAVGTPLDVALFILGKRSAFIMTGEPVQSTDTTAVTLDAIFADIKIQRVNYACGCVGEYTVVNTKYGTVWADAEEVWVLAAGTAPIPIGRKISEVLKNCPPERRWQWCAAYHDGFYMLGIVTADSVSTDEPQFEYWWLDLRKGPPQNWEEARWYGPMEYKWKSWNNDPVYMSNIAIDERTSSGNFGKPVVATTAPSSTSRQGHIVDMIGDTQTAVDTPLGNVHSAPVWTAFEPIKRGELVLPSSFVAGVPTVVYGSPGAKDGFIHMDLADGGGGDPNMGAPEPNWVPPVVPIGPAPSLMVVQNIGPVPLITDAGGDYSLANYVDNDVLVDILSKEFDFGDSHVTKTLDHVEMEAQVAHPTVVDISVIQNGGAKNSDVSAQVARNQLGIPVELRDQDPEAHGFILNQSLLGGSDLLADEKSVVTFYPDETQPLITSRYMNFRVKDRPGFYIDDTNRFLSLALVDATTQILNAGAGLMQVELDAQYFDNVYDFAQHLISRLQLAIIPWIGVYLPVTTWFVNYGTSPVVTQPLRQLYYSHSAVWPSPAGYIIEIAGLDAVTEFPGENAHGASAKKMLAFLGTDVDFFIQSQEWIAPNMVGPLADYAGWSAAASTPYRRPGKVLIQDILAEVIPNPRRPR